MRTKRITRILACLALLIVMGGELMFSAFFFTSEVIWQTQNMNEKSMQLYLSLY